MKRTKSKASSCSLLLLLGGCVIVVDDDTDSRRTEATRVMLNSLKQNIVLFQVRMNKLPESLTELRDGPSDADGKANWVAPIISEIPNDAWENALNYTKTGNTYELRSAGIDGQIYTDDDVVLEGA